MFQYFHILMFFLLCFLYYPPLSFSLPFQNTSSNHLCHQDDRKSLLHFINGFTIDSQNSGYDDELSYPKTKSWRVSIDCCLWDGVTCDSNSGRVIGLDLSHSQLGGIIHPNSTLFQLSHLQSLNLAVNDFKESHIPSNMGHFPSLRVLNLSYSEFAGDTPTELGLLSHLVSLDLSSSYDSNNELTMPYIDKIVKNLTHLRELHLSGVLINSSIPLTLANFSSSLSSLDLYYCNLKGAFPSNILSLPHLRFLSVGGNDNLYSNASHFNNLSSSVEVIDFSYTNLSGRLPEYTLGERRPPQLREFKATQCNLNGIIPKWVWNTTESIWLVDNQFIGELPSSINTKAFSQFHSLGLSFNLLKGPIPSWLLNNPFLKDLDLNGNQFTGKFNRPFPKHNCSLETLSLSDNKLSFFDLNSFSKCINLSEISLSDVSLIGGVNSTFFWPNLCELKMPSCNITIFPNFLKSQQNLEYLDLSNNRIQGEIPTWFYNVGKDSLHFLNISHNSLTGGLELHPWNVLVDIDIRSNKFQGLLPLPPSNHITSSFFASSNQFHGEINSSFCNLTVLEYLDLSNNSLSGNIPQCLGKLGSSLQGLDLRSNKFQGEINSSFCNLTMLEYLDLSNNSLRGNIPQCLGKLSSNLQVLILGSNNFHGIIPKTFTKNCTLQSIHLYDNQFEGTIPQSLKRCKQLEVLDLGSNRFNDSFPRWLDDLRELKVLVLRSNYFQGSINDELKENINPFPKLQILDLSRNQFSGRLPTSYIKKFKALMVENGDSNSKTRKSAGEYSYYYQDSLVLTMKGLSLTYKILSILTTLDFSNNQFSGKIPESVGELIALVALNVSHNQLTGRVPSSLAKLTSLESLDLSCNMLEGRIPSQLVNLTFLEYFNVSNNQLSGSIPQCTQFSTFPIDSFEGNLGLCGDPLPKCGNGGVPDDQQPTTPPSRQEGNDFIDIFTSISLWEIILIGFGLGATLGSVAGYFMLSAERPNWFSRKADRFEEAMMRRYKKQSRRQQRRT